MPFRFLDLPDELRLKMYRFMLPRGERIHLDPQLVIFPIPYLVPESYGSTSNLLRTCRTIHDEALQFIYHHNTVNIINATDPPQGNFLEALGGTACRFISKLECHVTEGLADLGLCWSTLVVDCPRLTTIRLVFYHERENWMKTLAQLGWYLHQNDDLDDSLFQLDVELHTSIWARPYIENQYSRLFQLDLERAERHARVYSVDLPSQVRHITIAASVYDTAAQGLTGWHGEGYEWGFRSVGNSDTEMKKTLRWVRMDEE